MARLVPNHFFRAIEAFPRGLLRGTEKKKAVEAEKAAPATETEVSAPKPRPSWEEFRAMHGKAATHEVKSGFSVHMAPASPSKSSWRMQDFVRVC